LTSAVFRATLKATVGGFCGMIKFPRGKHKKQALKKPLDVQAAAQKAIC